MTSSSVNSTGNKRSHKHLNYVPWEPSRAAVSRTELNKQIQSIPIPSLSTQLYRYQNTGKSARSPSPSAVISNRVKPTATVEPFQAPVNVDEIFYGVRWAEESETMHQCLCLASLDLWARRITQSPIWISPVINRNSNVFKTKMPLSNSS